MQFMLNQQCFISAEGLNESNLIHNSIQSYSASGAAGAT